MEKKEVLRLESKTTVTVVNVSETVPDEGQIVLDTAALMGMIFGRSGHDLSAIVKVDIPVWSKESFWTAMNRLFYRFVEIPGQAQLEIVTTDKATGYSFILTYIKTDLFDVTVRYRSKGDPVGPLGGFDTNGSIDMDNGQAERQQDRLELVFDTFLHRVEQARDVIKARPTSNFIWRFIKRLFT